MSVFGLLDTEDNLWMGDDNGPSLYADHDLARITAEFRSVQLGWSPTRIQATEYTQPATRKRDEVPVVRSMKGWLARRERGTI